MISGWKSHIILYIVVKLLLYNKFIMRIVQLLERIDKAKEVMDESKLKKLNTILDKAEKLLLSAAKASGIKIDDIIEIKTDVDETDWEEEDVVDTEEEDTEDEEDTTVAISPEESKMEKIKTTYSGLPEEKQSMFKEQMWERFSSLWL